jgi:hypothetical protein
MERGERVDNVTLQVVLIIANFWLIALFLILVVR